MFDYDFKEIQTLPKYKIESKNMKKYGTFYPPEYPLNNIKDFSIALICGKCDKICMPKDYTKLRDFLKKQNSLLGFVETKLGHDSILNPNGAEDSSNVEQY